MGAITTRLITIEEFDKLDLPKDRKWELHGGEPVEMPFASAIHNWLQHRILHLFEAAFPALVVRMEMGFQIEATNDKGSADVGVTTKQRGQEILAKGILPGAPELVVEVLSPSNTVMDMKDYQRLCFENGTQVFPMVNPANNTVELYLDAVKPDSVTAIFAGITLPETAPAS